MARSRSSSAARARALAPAVRRRVRRVHAHPDEGRGRVAQRRGRRVDPAVRGPGAARRGIAAAPASAAPRRRTVNADRCARTSVPRSPRDPEPVDPKTATEAATEGARPTAKPRDPAPGRPGCPASEPRRGGPATRGCGAEAGPTSRPPEPTAPPGDATPPDGSPRTLDPSTGSALSSLGAEWVILRYAPARRADVAQLVEQRFCKPQVPGSSPVVGSRTHPSVAGSTTGPQARSGTAASVGRLSRW